MILEVVLGTQCVSSEHGSASQNGSTRSMLLTAALLTVQLYKKSDNERKRKVK